MRFFCLALSVGLCSCGLQKSADIKFERFDAELYEVLLHSEDSALANQFEEKYASFLPLYIEGVMRMKPEPGVSQISLLRRLFSDSTLMSIYRDELSTFQNLEKQESELSEAFDLYRTWFPQDSIPVFRMHLSGLSQSVVTQLPLVSVAGDKYLGEKYQPYSSYFYSYQLPLMNSQNLVPDAIKAYLEARFPVQGSDVLFDRMIYEGVILAATEELLPDETLQDLLGFNSDQMEWLVNNEKNVWIYMVQNEQLYTSDPLVVAKYMDEAPFTSYFGQNSPSRIGKFIGYKIVKEYLKRADGDVAGLLVKADAKIILQKSGYRP